jgi:hypothetical protein
LTFGYAVVLYIEIKKEDIMNETEVMELRTREEINDAVARARRAPEPATGRGRPEVYDNPAPTGINEMELWHQRNIEENQNAIDNMLVGDAVVQPPRAPVVTQTNDMDQLRDQLLNAMGVPTELVTEPITNPGIALGNREGITRTDFNQPEIGIDAGNIFDTLGGPNAVTDTGTTGRIWDVGNTIARFGPQKYHCPSCDKTITSKFSFVWKEDNENEENQYDFCPRCLAHALHQMVPKLRPLPREELPIVNGTVTFTPAATPEWTTVTYNTAGATTGRTTHTGNVGRNVF